MKLKPRSFLCIAAVVLVSLSAPAQLTIDATGPDKELREAPGGRIGSIGRKLPLKVAVEVPAGPSSDNGKTVVEFILTNSGKEGLNIPVSPDPGDVEPADAETKYSFKLLNLYITSEGKRRATLPGGARLYGNDESATLVALAPGDSIRVCAKVALSPATAVDQSSTVVFVAHAMLVDETVTAVDGKPFMDGFEVGSAKSPEYALEASGNLRVSSAPEEKKQ